jgi:hypothetical protein
MSVYAHGIYQLQSFRNHVQVYFPTDGDVRFVHKAQPRNKSKREEPSAFMRDISCVAWKGLTHINTGNGVRTLFLKTVDT